VRVNLRAYEPSAEDLAILIRQNWLYGRPYPLGIFLIYKSLTKLFCAITGTRPKVLFPAKPTAATEITAEEGNPSDVLTFARRLKGWQQGAEG